MKKILITGITGMVGSHLADYIYSNTNWIIHGLIRWRSSLENLDIVKFGKSRQVGTRPGIS